MADLICARTFGYYYLEQSINVYYWVTRVRHWQKIVGI